MLVSKVAGGTSQGQENEPEGVRAFFLCLLDRLLDDADDEASGAFDGPAGALEVRKPVSVYSPRRGAQDDPWRGSCWPPRNGAAAKHGQDGHILWAGHSR